MKCKSALIALPWPLGYPKWGAAGAHYPRKNLHRAARVQGNCGGNMNMLCDHHARREREQGREWGRLADREWIPDEEKTTATR